ncbi:MAG: hypothetical protein ACI4QS_09775 [Comamonas sp.]
MSAIDFINHLLNFMLPAAFLGVLLAVGARWVWRKETHLLPWWQMASVNFLLGVLILALGLVLSGHDGRMGVYACLVLGMASCQWLMSMGWKR